MTENIYDFFNIKKDADDKEIKKAYRKKAKKTHPDMNNGEENKDFQKTNKYYMILLDSKKRERYDETGKIDEKNEEKNLYISFLASLFKNLMESQNNFNFDIFEMMEKKIKGNIQKAEMNIGLSKKLIEKLKKIEKRITPKKDNIFITVLMNDVKIQEENIISIKEQIKMQKDAYDYLKKGKFKYEYEKEVEKNILLRTNYQGTFSTESGF